MTALLPVAKIAHVPWWRRLLARVRVPDYRTEVAIVIDRVNAEIAEERRHALNKQLADVFEHISDRDRQIRILREQVRELGGTPIEVKVIRKPLPTFIPGPGVSVKR